MKLPEAALQQHIAVLGKTGSGKTSTAKLIVEQVHAAGARVCILDPIKSDWWGLISSADGRSPGLPFHILGGPRGHVPLHAAAGRAIGELVAGGQLPHSIIDMADFEPGGQARFFVDFAPALLRHMRGVVYLVLEEAHLFAPKERSGVGAENMSIHWAKMLATAGRSKGIRLILVTQRTQALHNALLGSCETMLAHRLIAPADQKPVLQWLEANVDATLFKQVEASLSSLSTGEAWICSGEARLFHRHKFGRIHTYDNTATPTNDAHQPDVATAPVDREALKAILGAAVKEMEETDPERLKAEISRLRAELARAGKAGVDIEGITATAEKRGHARGIVDGYRSCYRHMKVALGTFQDHMQVLLESIETEGVPAKEAPARLIERNLLDEVQPPHQDRAAAPRRPAAAAKDGKVGDRAQRAFLTALAQQARRLTRNQVAIFAGYSATSRHVDNTLAALRAAGLVVGGRDAIEITPAGKKALGKYEPLPTGTALREYWMRELDKAGAEFLRVICEAYPRTLTRDQVAEKAGYSPTSRHVDNTLAQLRSRDLVSGGRAAIKASDNLF